MAKTNAIADLLGVATARTEKADGYILVDYETQLVNRKDNRDVDFEAVSDLARSIEKDGLAQPILARTIPDKSGMFELIAGQHRCEAYRLLHKRNPNDPRWSRIECKVVKGMDDETAHRLMLATNVVDANRSQAERGRMLIELYGATAEKIKKEKGGRIRDIVRDLYEEETGKSIGSNTVERAMNAAKSEEKDIQANNSDLLCEWQEVFEDPKLKIPNGIKSSLSNFSKDEQRIVYRDWRESGSNNRWLKEEIELRSGNPEKLLKKAQGFFTDACGLVARCQRYAKDQETNTNVDKVIQDFLSELKKAVERSKSV